MRLLIVIALPSLLAGGCFGESHLEGDPVPLERFCGVFFDALCGPIEDCGCGAAAVEACRLEQRDLCGFFPSEQLRVAVEEGRVIYDPAAASELARGMRARGCDGFIPTFGWRVRDLFGLGGTFVGTRGAGQSCEVLGFELVSECVLGSCASTPGGAICRVSVGEGERCDGTHQCVDLDAEITTESRLDRLVLPCEEDVPGGEVGTCRAWLAEGDGCETDGACWTDRCIGGRCEAQVLGGECVTEAECAAGLYCLGGACAAGGAPEGAVCGFNAECASRVCVVGSSGGTCMPPGCGTF